MKNYKEMAESLFERRQKYNVERKKKKQRTKRLTSATACCVVLLTSVVITHSNLSDTNISVDDQLSIPASSETKLVPVLEENTHDSDLSRDKKKESLKKSKESMDFEESFLEYVDMSSSSSSGAFDAVEIDDVELSEWNFFDEPENILMDSTPEILKINSVLNISFIE